MSSIYNNYQLIYIVRYSQVVTDVCLNNENLYKMANVTLKQLLPGYEPTKPVWLYPIIDYELKFFAIMFVNPFTILGEKGFITLQIRVDLLYQSILDRKPSANGFYAILVYSDEYNISSYGSIGAASEESIEILMGKKMTVDEIQQSDPVQTLEYSTSGFSEVYNSIKAGFDYVEIKAINGIRYHVQWKKSDLVSCMILAVIPIDELIASWEMKPAQLSFYFSESLDGKKVNISMGDTELFNTGNYILRWHLKYPKANIITIPSEGILKPHQSVKLSYYINDLLGERNSVVFEASGDNSNCYEPLVVALNQMDYSCKESNYYAVLDNKCESFHRNIHFLWNESQICQLGVALPGKQKIECSIYFINIIH